MALKRSDDMPEYLLAHLTAMWQFFDALDYNKDRLLDPDGEALVSSMRTNLLNICIYLIMSFLMILLYFRNSF